MRKFLLLLISLGFTATAGAAPRTPQAMLQAAQHQFAAMYRSYGKKAPAIKPDLLREDSAFRIYGYAGGQFVVVSADDLMPEILGYSDNGAAVSNGKNPNFEWWLSAVREATREAIRTNTPRTTTAPDPSKYKRDVAALVTSNWGQDTPYNDLCPDAPYSNSWYGSGTARAVTGCVATAMAQILYYHKAPAHGVGTHSVGVPFDYPTATYTFDFGNATFDWDNMLDNYTQGNYNSTEANAVATLMYACGIASDMQYAPDGSGTYTENASDGLKRNFGLSEDVHVEDRSKYSEADWMNLVYNEVDAGRPILYTGVSGYDGGHAFVLDGYNNKGQVHINWGWDGSDNGMYDIATLAVENYSFSSYQDMCIGISAEREALAGDTVTVDKAGMLNDMFPTDSVRASLGVLKVSGDINSSDLAVLRYMCGVDAKGNATKGRLNTLDLSEARIVSGGNPYLYEGDKRYTTDDNVLPERAFYGARRLSKLYLPKGIKHVGDGALAVGGLREVKLLPAADADFFIKDDVLYSKVDSADLIAVMPSKSGYLTLPLGTRTIHPYAMANVRGLAGLRVSSTVENIGEYAFANMAGLTELRMYSKEPPLTGDKAVSGFNFANCKLYVPAGSKTRYANHSQWGQFKSTSSNYDNIVEFGTRVKARNAFKIYGDPAPRLGYKIEGDAVHGDPEVSTDVNELTPVGRYPIHVNRGTIREQEGVEYADGYCIVAPDTLFASVGDYTRDANAADPEFKITIKGFDNGENESVIEEMPVATTTATATSPAGEYPIVLSGGKAANYFFQFTDGTLTVTGVVDGIDAVRLAANGKPFDIYSVSGQLVRHNATSAEGLQPGLYIVNGKKIVVGQ